MIHPVQERLTRSISGISKPCVKELASIMHNILDQLPASRHSSNVFEADEHYRTSSNAADHATCNQPIFWMIDRLDECLFKGCHGSIKLYDFMKMLDSLVGSSNGRLRVLITCLYPPQKLDSRWVDCVEDDEEGLKSFKFLELERRRHHRMN